jgi:predicted ArsR family transcriptional regulator
MDIRETRRVDSDHELSVVLADDTRYRIYRAIAERPGEDVTVADIARRFGLHPNVARMHLGKLEQGGFVATGFRRSSGGRPAKLYRLSDRVVSFGFPPRRYELLSRLALEALAAGGSRADALRVCHEAGAAEGRRALVGGGRPPADATDAAELVLRITEDQGLLPEIVWQDDAFRVTLRNCVFGVLSGGEPELVCAMHRAFLEGVFEIVTDGSGHVSFKQEACGIGRGDDRCAMLCSLPADDGRRERWRRVEE